MLGCLGEFWIIKKRGLEGLLQVAWEAVIWVGTWVLYEVRDWGLVEVGLDEMDMERTWEGHEKGWGMG